MGEEGRLSLTKRGRAIGLGATKRVGEEKRRRTSRGKGCLSGGSGPVGRIKCIGKEKGRILAQLLGRGKRDTKEKEGYAM